MDVVLARRLRQNLADEGLLHKMSDSDACAFFGCVNSSGDHTLSRVAYVDDGVIPVVAPAAQLPDKLSQVASVARSTYQQHGLDLNFAHGKSEAIVRLCGPGSKKVRKRLFVDAAGLLDCLGCAGEKFQLRIVSRYRHLGGIITGSGDMSSEIGPKMATVRSTVRKLRKPFLRDPRIPLATKGQVLQSLVLARGMHLGGCWPGLLHREAKTLNRSIIDMLRPLLGDRPVDQRMSDETIISELGVLYPIRLVSLLRVQTAIRVAERAPVQLLVLLHASRHAERSWIRALAADLSHISRASCLEELRGAPVSKWFAFFRTNPSLARRVVLKAVVATNWQTVEEREAMRETTTYCTFCGVPVLGRQALSVHVFRAHGLRRPICSPGCPLGPNKRWQR